MRLQDAETGRQVLVDTSSRAVREQFAARGGGAAAAFTKLARGAQADLIEVGTDGDHFDALLGFFRKRDRRRRHGWNLVLALVLGFAQADVTWYATADRTKDVRLSDSVLVTLAVEGLAPYASSCRRIHALRIRSNYYSMRIRSKCGGSARAARRSWTTCRTAGSGGRRRSAPTRSSRAS